MPITEKQRAYQAAYRAQHRERIYAQQAEWRAKNAEAIKQAKRDYYKANAEAIKAKVARWQKENPERVRAARKRNRATNPAVRAYDAKFRVANRDIINERNRAHHHKNRDKRLAQKSAWAAANRDLHAAYSARRRAAMFNATPIWGDEELVRDAFLLAQRRSAATGIRWEVDHIVPLNSKLVCGLHVIENLQVIPWRENRSKGNRRWPDMPGTQPNKPAKSGFFVA